MNIVKKSILITFSITLLSIGSIFAQLEGIHPDYLKTLNNRAGKIVDDLSLEDKDQADRVQEIIVIQYYQLSKIHDDRDEKLEKTDHPEGAEKEAAKQLILDEANAKLYKLHAHYLAKLSAELTQDQVEQVKDGMTYSVLKHTYQGYLNLLPELTEAQKRFIYSNLAEARELAMDGGSSDAKHAWFGKYKGKINNYLSDAGYDLKKAEQEMRKRDKE